MAMEIKNFIIDVIPLTRIPLTRQQHFSYEYGQKLPPGTLVSIPLFRRFLNGIVINSRDDFHRLGNMELKKIGKVLEENFLTGKQIELAKFISSYYLSPIGAVLKFFVPMRAHLRKRDLQPMTNNLQQRKIKLTEEQQLAMNEITKSYKLKAKSYLLFGPASSGKTEVYIHSIKEIKNKNPDAQFLVLLPEIMLAPMAIERFEAYFKSEEIAVLHSKITKGEFYQNWQKIKSGEAKIIVGTRMAVFAPFRNLKLIIIDEEQDISFKQWDMNPRYHARTVAEKLAELHQAEIMLESAAPAIESYYRATKGELGLLKLPYLDAMKIPNPKSQNYFPKVEVVDMKKERWIKNYSPLSKKLISEIEWALKNKLQVILFINRQGISAFSICESCRNVLRCPKCERALVYDFKGNYRCLHCSYQSEIFTACPKCKAMVFRNIGAGTQKIEKEITKLFPAASIERIDAETTKKIGLQKKIYEKFSGGKIDILIGTQQIIKGWDLPNINLVGIIDADNLLGIPDFKTDERAFQNIVRAAGRLAGMGKKQAGRMIIQTFNPGNPVIKTASSLDYESFYNREIEDRKALKLPPFARLLKLIIRGAGKNRIEKEAWETFEKIIAIGSPNLKTSEPHDPLVSKVRGKFRKQIVIKLIEKRNLPPKLLNILEKLGSQWVIDVDPISLV